MGFQTACHIIEVVPLGGDLWFVTDNEADSGRLMHGDFHSLARDWVASRGKGTQNIKVIGELELGERSDTMMKLLKNVYDTDHSLPQRVCQIPGPAWDFNLITTTTIASKIETSDEPSRYEKPLAYRSGCWGYCLLFGGNSHCGSGLNVLGKMAFTGDRSLMQMNWNEMPPLRQADSR